MQISKPEESVQKIVREAAVPQLPAQLHQFQLEGRQGDPIVTGPLQASLYYRTAETILPV